MPPANPFFTVVVLVAMVLFAVPQLRSIYRGWSPLSTSVGNLATTIFTLVGIAAGAGILGFALVPALSDTAVVLDIVLFSAVALLLLLMIIRIVQGWVSN